VEVALPYTMSTTPARITQTVISTDHFVSFKVTGKTSHIDALALDGSVPITSILKPR
jgi:hypothetical protein